MKILFIGGTGNISADCAVRLYEHGHDILVVSRGQSPVPVEYQTLQADRKDGTLMRAALANVAVDVVINFQSGREAGFRIQVRNEARRAALGWYR